MKGRLTMIQAVFIMLLWLNNEIPMQDLIVDLMLNVDILFCMQQLFS